MDLLSLLTELNKGYLRSSLAEMDAVTGSVLASCSGLTEALGNMHEIVLTKRLEHQAGVWYDYVPKIRSVSKTVSSSLS